METNTNVATMNRADLECVIIEHEILPCNSTDDLAKWGAMTTEQLREAVRAWILAGDETGAA